MTLFECARNVVYISAIRIISTQIRSFTLISRAGTRSLEKLTTTGHVTTRNAEKKKITEVEKEKNIS